MRHSATNPPTVNAQNGLLKYCWLITMHEKAEQFKSRAQRFFRDRRRWIRPLKKEIVYRFLLIKKRGSNQENTDKQRAKLTAKKKVTQRPRGRTK